MSRWYNWPDIKRLPDYLKCFGLFSVLFLGRKKPIYLPNQSHVVQLGVDRLSAPILSILPIIDIGHFKNRFADNFFFFFFLCKQTYYLQVTLFIGE